MTLPDAISPEPPPPEPRIVQLRVRRARSMTNPRDPRTPDRAHWWDLLLGMLGRS
jgi:hypothetical protein